MNAPFLTILFLTSFSWTLCANIEALIKPTSVVYLFDSEHTIKFEENLVNYYAKANTLFDNTILLENLCTQNPKLPNCKYCVENLKIIANRAKRETQYLQLKHHKRELLCFLLSTLVISISVAIASFYTGIAVASQSNIIEQQNLQINTTAKHLELDFEGLKLLNDSFQDEFYNDNAFRTNMTEIEYMNNLVDTSIMTAEIHNQNTMKYLNALGNDLREKFFSIIDISTFNKTFHSTMPDSPSASLHPKDILELSFLHSELINDTITIYVQIPILTQNRYFLTTLTPIPITRDNTNFILNMDTKYLIEGNSTIAEISHHTLSQCAQAAKLVVCHSSFWHELSTIDNCVNALMSNKSTKGFCIYKKLPYKTLLTKICNNSLYALIISPILLKISCGHSSNILNVTSSGEIFYKENCKFFKQNINASKELNITTVKIESKLTGLNFEIFDNKTWSNRQIFANQFNNKAATLIKNMRNLSMNFHQRAKLIEISDWDPFSLVVEFFNEISDNFKEFVILLTLISTAIFFLITFTCFICCTCRK